MERNDCHSPKNLIPADYEFVALDYVKVEDLGSAMWAQENRRIIREHMARTGGTYSRHTHGGNCGVCGNVNAIYTVLFYHAKTNSYVRTGQECAELIDRQAAEGLTKLRRQVADAREAVAGIRKATALLADAGISAAMDLYKAEWSESMKRDEVTVRDIVGKVVKYGNISEKQVAFVKTLLGRIANRPAYEAKLAAEKALAADCPSGRVTITGEILSTKIVESAYGKTEKMLVKADEGFKVWLTLPGNAAAGKGDRITFKATVTPSEDDRKFGFGKRPTLVSVEPKTDAEAEAAIG